MAAVMAFFTGFILFEYVEPRRMPSSPSGLGDDIIDQITRIYNIGGDLAVMTDCFFIAGNLAEDKNFL